MAGALAVAQTLARASTRYLLAMLAVALANELGVCTPPVFTAFSMTPIMLAIPGP